MNAELLETIIISRWEYEELIRTSQNVSILKRYLDSDGYSDNKTIRVILGMDEDADTESAAKLDYVITHLGSDSDDC